MNVLELFAGSKSFSKEAEKLGMNTFASDYKNFEDIDYVTDILERKAWGKDNFKNFRNY